MIPAARWRRQLDGDGAMARYSAAFLDHFQSPRNAGELADANAVGTADVGGGAPRISIYLRANGPKIVAATFTTFGCGGMIASGSALTEMVVGRRVQDAATLQPEHVIAALGGMPAEKLFCAELAIAALHRGLDAIRQANNRADHEFL
jgi:nitrogen fixation NifU-like protein